VRCQRKSEVCGLIESLALERQLDGGRAGQVKDNVILRLLKPPPKRLTCGDAHIDDLGLQGNRRAREKDRHALCQQRLALVVVISIRRKTRLRPFAPAVPGAIGRYTTLPDSNGST